MHIGFRQTAQRSAAAINAEPSTLKRALSDDGGGAGGRTSTSRATMLHVFLAASMQRRSTEENYHALHRSCAATQWSASLGNDSGGRQLAAGRNATSGLV